MAYGKERLREKLSHVTFILQIDNFRCHRTRMHNGMSLEGDSRNELLITDVTSEWLHSSVSSHVRLQLQLSTECLVTLVTFEGFVSCMYCL